MLMTQCCECHCNITLLWHLLVLISLDVSDLQAGLSINKFLPNEDVWRGRDRWPSNESIEKALARRDNCESVVVRRGWSASVRFLVVVDTSSLPTDLFLSEQTRSEHSHDMRTFLLLVDHVIHQLYLCSQQLLSSSNIPIWLLIEAQGKYQLLCINETRDISDRFDHTSDECWWSSKLSRDSGCGWPVITERCHHHNVTSFTLAHDAQLI